MTSVTLNAIYFVFIFEDISSDVSVQIPGFLYDWVKNYIKDEIISGGNMTNADVSIETIR